MAIQRRHIPRLSDAHNDVPPELDAIIARALSWHRADRFDSAREMGQALTRLYAARGDSVSVPELSSLMGRLFAERKEAQRQLVRSALSSPTPPSHRLFPRLPPAESEQSRSGIVQRSNRTRMERRRPRPRRRRKVDWKSGLVAFVVAFLATTVVGGSYLLLRASGPDPAPVPAQAPD